MCSEVLRVVDLTEMREIMFLFKRFHGAFLFGRAMAFTTDLPSLGHRVLS